MAKTIDVSRRRARNGGKRDGVETPLSRWLYRFRMSPTEMARRIGFVSNSVIMWSRGHRTPNVAAIAAIARETLKEEIELGLAEPRGILVSDWFDEIAIAAESAKAAG